MPTRNTAFVKKKKTRSRNRVRVIEAVEATLREVASGEEPASSTSAPPSGPSLPMEVALPTEPAPQPESATASSLPNEDPPISTESTSLTEPSLPTAPEAASSSALLTDNIPPTQPGSPAESIQLIELAPLPKFIAPPSATEPAVTDLQNEPPALSETVAVRPTAPTNAPSVNECANVLMPQEPEGDQLSEMARALAAETVLALEHLLD